MIWDAAFGKVQDDLYLLFCAENRNYGDALVRHGTIGCLVRIGDKLQQLQMITRNKVEVVADESTEDTLLDLANYCTLAVAMMRRDRETG